MLDEAIKRFNSIYTRALQRGQLVPDSSLIIENPEAQPEDLEVEEEADLSLELDDSLGGDGDSPVAISQQNIIVQWATPNAATVQSGLSAVRAIPGVSSASTSSLALGGVSVMRVMYSGEASSLAAALSSRGWSVQQGPGVLRISRGASPQPAPQTQPRPQQPAPQAQPPAQNQPPAGQNNGGGNAGSSGGNMGNSG